MFSIKEVESIQGEFNAVLTELEKFKPRDTEYKNKKVKLLENVKSFQDGREMINLRWCCAQNLLGSQIPVTTGG